MRDWLYVEDHARAIKAILEHGKTQEVYNVGGNSVIANIDVVHKLIQTYARIADEDPKKLEELITFVKDRPGHDLRYAIDSSKIENTCGFKAEVDFDRGLEKTVAWSLDQEGVCT